MTQLSNGEGETKVIQAYQDLTKAIDNHNYRWRYKKKATTKNKTIKHRSEKNKDIIKQELGLFNEIWNERPRICKICQRVLTVFNPILFHHLKTKGSHPELRLEKSNIVLLCDACHMGEHSFKPKLDRYGNLK